MLAVGVADALRLARELTLEDSDALANAVVLEEDVPERDAVELPLYAVVALEEPLSLGGRDGCGEALEVDETELLREPAGDLDALADCNALAVVEEERRGVRDDAAVSDDVGVMVLCTLPVAALLALAARAVAEAGADADAVG